MKTRTITEALSTSVVRSEPRAPFHLVSLFEDEAAAAAARQKVIGLVSRFLAPLEVHPDEWQFSDFSNEHFAREALELAAGCDLLILSARLETGLPSQVIDWFEQWLQDRQLKDSAVVFLAGSEHGNLADTPLQMRLEQRARTHSLEFFAGAYLVSSQPASLAFGSPASSPDCWDRWGINE